MKIRKFYGDNPPQKGFNHWCPGCKTVHGIRTEGPKPNWTWDGNEEAPTTSPSIRCFTTYDEHGNPLPDDGQRTLCHYFLRAGMIDFCSDSPHEFAGKTVPLPDYPQEWQ